MKILVVDDDPVSRRVLRQVLAAAEAGCEVAEAAAGVEACKMLARPGHGFDVVFLDISLPDINGLDLLARWRANAALSSLPVILCTSSNDRATVVKAAVAGARHYVVKPPNLQTVTEKLKLVHAKSGAGNPPTVPEVAVAT